MLAAAGSLNARNNQISKQTTKQIQDSTTDWGYVYILGGDSFVKTTDEDAGERGGGYTNDVWVSEGAGWEVYSDGNKPMAKTNMKWDEINPGRLPPVDLTYEEWIICQVRLGVYFPSESVVPRKDGLIFGIAILARSSGQVEVALIYLAEFHTVAMDDKSTCTIVSRLIETATVRFHQPYYQVQRNHVTTVGRRSVGSKVSPQLNPSDCAIIPKGQGDKLQQAKQDCLYVLHL